MKVLRSAVEEVEILRGVNEELENESREIRNIMEQQLEMMEILRKENL